MTRGAVQILGLMVGLLMTGLPIRTVCSAEDGVIGNPISLTVEPKSATLIGPRASRQILVTGHYADGSVRDLTHACDWNAVNPSLAAITSAGYVTPRGDGSTHIEVRAGKHVIRVPVEVVDSGKSPPVSFGRELMPVLSVVGCSDIRCHGSPSGKNGFRLSLWGSDPELDFQQLTRDVLGRRTNVVDPDRSLMLRKALARTPHVGGQRFHSESPYANLIRRWQSEGLRNDPAPVVLKSVTVTPDTRVLKAPAKQQQLSAVATFGDGRTADVTRLTSFASSDPAVAAVDRTGLVTFKAQGEVAILCRFLGRMVSVRLMHIARPAPDFRWPNPPENNYVDTHVFAKLKMLNIAPSALCSDEQFIRRASLDLCGILPPPDAVRAFVAAKEPDKRARLIDRLLSRPEFADLWTRKWTDVLRVSRDSIQWAGSKAYHGWLRERIANDASFAQTVHAMLTAQGASYSKPPVNYYCVPQIPKNVDDPFYLEKDLAEATAQLFMGVRLQCAKCHNHPYENWSQQDYLGLAAHFTQIKRSRLGKAGPSGRAERRQIMISLDFKAKEIVNETTGTPVLPQLRGMPVRKLGPKEDRRRQLADWLTGKGNPYFARAIVNRVWFHLHGRGIVEPVDDFRDSNPSANDALLDALTADFIAGGYRLKPLIRTITNSRSYQLSALPNSSNRNDERYFSHMLVRPLPAEILLDAICDVTGVPENFQITNDYTIGVPKGFIKLPAGTRAVQLPVNDINTLINSASKYVRYESHPFLRAFGQPTRTQTCECDREQKFGRKQALELIIGQMTAARLARKGNRLDKLLAEKNTDREILDELYLRTLSRLPSEATTKAFLKHIAGNKDKRNAWEDVVWTLLNSQEFIFQH